MLNLVVRRETARLLKVSTLFQFKQISIDRQITQFLCIIDNSLSSLFLETKLCASGEASLIPEAKNSSTFLIGILYQELIRNPVRNAWNTVLKATEKHTQERNSERSDGECGIFDTDTPRITAQMLINELVSVLYPCHSDVQLYRPRNILEISAAKIDMITTTHSFIESVLKMLLHLWYSTEHGKYHRTRTM
jgi:hypothetical protein